MKKRQRIRKIIAQSALAAWCLLVLSLSSSSSAFAPLHRRIQKQSRLSASLESLTVKELRERVKEESSEKGVLSRLKRKQDLIEYLHGLSSKEKFAVSANNDNDVVQISAQNEQVPVLVSLSDRRRKSPTKLPPLIDPTLKTATSVFQSPKDAIFRDVCARYPPMLEQVEALLSDTANVIHNDQDDTDIRQLYHPMLQASQNSSDMDIVFIGTASCTPGTTRGVSCTALRLNWNRRTAFFDADTGRVERQNAFQGGTWLFDVGECTQLQIQRTGAVRPSKITKIFLTHAHGDHSFGLPGLLCLMGQDRDRQSPPVDIYGPQGLRMWLRVAIRYSVSRIVPPYRVHEIMDVPMAPEWEYSPRTRRYFCRGKARVDGSKIWEPKGLAGEDGVSWITQAKQMNLQPSPMYGEIEGGRDIYPIYDHPKSSFGAPVWEVENEEDVKVYAAPMSHGIPCLGYVVEELQQPGRLRSEYVEPIVIRNIDALKEAGFVLPMKAMAVIKNLQPGSAFTFPDGTVVTHEDALDPPRPARKVVFCGDTSDSRALLNLAQDADVVIHEATNSYLSGVDRDTSSHAVTRDAIIHGHSTPYIAGDFARAANAKRLVLTHFSARYKGDTCVESLSIMMRIERQAMKASLLKESQVAAAWDLMVLPVPRSE